ncbi:peptidoglycan-binding protein [Marininema halotolerans]|uniref:Sporulation related domain-containing protein n=1 Tax=Marininema halotolerans TaxID=1155944 RepID=A0A1I6URD0_9BACL|nr:peptidoglycan-binding protein [Marininema halotolerans]SFT03991.1 Sporulation related domain-containing protein [Marininema halotolerans]
MGFETYGGQKIKIDFLSGVPKRPFRNGTDRYEMVIMHDTDSVAPATNQAKYFHREWNNRKAFVHFFVDKSQIIQQSSIHYQAWGAGNANPRGLHLELCREHSKADKLAGYEKWCRLAAWLLHRRGLGVRWGKTLVTHHWVSQHLGGTDHADPDAYLKTFGVSISEMVDNVEKYYRQYGGETKTNPDPVGTKDFPGRGSFKIGHIDPAVTLLGQRLVAHGFGKFYKKGPGPRFTEVDRKACAAFQRSQGWTGSDADGRPGPETWKRLMADPPKSKPKPKPKEKARYQVQAGAFAEQENAEHQVKALKKAGFEAIVEEK